VKLIMKNEIMVSIICTAYNHENYIAGTIDSFLRQITDFPYEILIHDDASTDRTPEIIREYELKYPGLIKPVYQKENKYSRGISPAHYLYHRAKGKYIAICEGDDYWIDPDKLQKQINYMESHPDCTFCCTNGKIVDAGGKQDDRVFVPYSPENEAYFSGGNRTYNAGELALLGFIPTASFVFPRNIFEDLPEFYYRRFPAGDIKLKLVAASKGCAYYINDVTCVYRTNVSDSLMTKWNSYNRRQVIDHNQGYLDLIDLIDGYTNYKYTREFDQLKVPFELSKLIAQRDKNVFKNERYKERLGEMGKKQRMAVIGSIYFPKMYGAYEALKRALGRG